MKNRLIVFISLLLTAATYAQERKQPDPVISAMHSISSHDLLEYVKIQCDEKYAGRLTGTAEYQDELWKFVEEANEKYIHRALSTNYFSNLGRPRLDAARFLSAGVPSLSFATYGSKSNYHLPGDNIDIIKPEIMEDLAQLLFMTVVNIGNFDEALRVK